MKQPTSREAGAYLFAITLAGADAIAAADRFFPQHPETRYFGVLVLFAGLALLAWAIIVGE
jgi:hypothetical protein